MVQRNHVMLGDLVEVLLAKRWQQVVAQIRVVTVPRLLVALDEWQVTLGNEVSKRWNGPQDCLLYGWVIA